MVGELLDLSEGKRTEESLRLAYESGRRDLLGKTMPAKGLTLLQVEYE
jgi:tRNA U38,U39,U40 pseudouridine synthase TruA